MLKPILEKAESIYQLGIDIIELCKQILEFTRQKQIPEPADEEPVYLTITEAATFCRVSKRTFERLNNANLVTVIYVGGSPFFNKATLAQEIKANKLDTRKKN
ncbi:MAG TPA: hypothetical protein VGC08_11070 [Pedobacter sp.]